MLNNSPLIKPSTAMNSTSNYNNQYAIHIANQLAMEVVDQEKVEVALTSQQHSQQKRKRKSVGVPASEHPSKKVCNTQHAPNIHKDVTVDLAKSTDAFKAEHNAGNTAFYQYLSLLNKQIQQGITPTIDSEPFFPMKLSEFISRYSDRYSINDMPPNNVSTNIIIHSITYPDSLLMTEDQYNIISGSKVTITQSKIHKKLVSKLSGSALLKNHQHQSYVRFVSGSWDAILIRDIHQDEETTIQWPLAMNYHINHSKGLAKGCNASGIPTVEDMNWALKQHFILEHFGVKNAMEIIKVAPARVGSTNSTRMYYKNRQGKLIDWAFSQWINYHTMTLPQARKQLFGNTILSTARSLWLMLCPVSFCAHGIKPIHFDELMNAAVSEQYIQFGSNLQDNGISKPRLIHHDPYSCYPTIVQGPTVYKVLDGKWKKQCNGGELIMVNGYHHLDYKPNDITFVKPQAIHAVSTLSSFNGGNLDLVRFSHTQSCTFLRGKKYINKWRERMER